MVARRMRRGLAAVLVAAATALACAGCIQWGDYFDSPHFAYGLTSSQLVGSYGLDGPDGSRAELTLVADGTFSAAEWPSNLACGENPTTDLSEVDWSVRIDHGGTWEFRHPDAAPSVHLSTLGSSCGWANSPSVIRVDDDRLGLEFRLHVTEPEAAILVRDEDSSS